MTAPKLVWIVLHFTVMNVLKALNNQLIAKNYIRLCCLHLLASHDCSNENSLKTFVGGITLVAVEPLSPYGRIQPVLMDRKAGHH